MQNKQQATHINKRNKNKKVNPERSYKKKLPWNENQEFKPVKWFPGSKTNFDFYKSK